MSQKNNESLVLTSLPVEILTALYQLVFPRSNFISVNHQFYEIHLAQINRILASYKKIALFITSIPRDVAENFIDNYFYFGSKPLNQMLHHFYKNKQCDIWTTLCLIFMSTDRYFLRSLFANHNINNLIKRLVKENASLEVIHSLQQTHALVKNPSRSFNNDTSIQAYFNQRCLAAFPYLPRAHLKSIKWPKANFTLGNLEKANMAYSNFSFAHFSEANMQSTFAWYANFFGAQCDGVKMKNSMLRDTIFENADFEDADLDGVFMWQANCKGTHFRNAIISNAVLWDVCLEDACMHGANLCNTDLTGANVKNTDLSNIIANENTIFPKDLTGAKFLAAKAFLNIQRFEKALDEMLRFKDHLQFKSIKNAVIEQVIDTIHSSKVNISFLQYAYRHALFQSDIYVETKSNFFLPAKELQRFIFESREQTKMAEAYHALVV